MPRTAYAKTAWSALALVCGLVQGCDPRRTDGTDADDAAGVRVADPAVVPATSQSPPPGADDALAALDGAGRMAVLGCAACHAGLPGPTSAAPLLAGSAGPRDPAALFAYLSDSLPSRPRVDGARMPDFHLTEAEAVALALYLGRGRADGDARTAFVSARRAHPDVGPEDGAHVYEAFRCGACHEGAGARPAPDAPALSFAGARVREGWLRGFLRQPHAVRPFGAVPGSGVRMPDFGLADDDVDAIVATLLDGDVALPPFEPRAPSAFAARKVETLLSERYDCLGCHAWNGAGGRIAPDLATVGTRLQPAYIRALLEDPERLVTGTMMPRSRLPAAELDALASFLATRTSTGPVDADYLSPIDHPTLPVAAAATDSPGVPDYLRRCAACHGAGGHGDGFNAAYLDAPPAVHADAGAMRLRPDDTLHDGIAAGGRILGRSARMPAYGASLAPDEIRALVAHIRTLCDCAGPAWSSDGSR
jgi:mono/diheme cytochrome c family protein